MTTAPKCLAALFAVVAAATALTAQPPKPAPFGAVTLLRTPDRGIQPQAITDAKGVLHLIYFKGEPGTGDVFYVKSTDGGTKFSRPLRVNSVDGSVIAAGNIRAQLAVGRNGRVHVSWMGSKKTATSHADMPMLYVRLNDDGTAFEPQRNLIKTAYGLDGGGSVGADDAGNVYVAWHAPEAGAKGEENRRVWVARSADEGKTFAAETPISDKSTGACGCCGMKAFSDRKGNVYMLYRGAADHVNRDTYFIASKDLGKSFESSKVQPWNVDHCPMSSFAFAEAKDGNRGAWETDGQVYFARIDPASGKLSAPVAAPKSGRGCKHPAVAGNDKGETILVWTEGMGWNKGGAVAWQVFDKNGAPTGEAGRTDGVPTWSLVTVVARADGGFTIVW